MRPRARAFCKCEWRTLNKKDCSSIVQHVLTWPGRLAGSDTTATGIRTTFLNIISNPQIYARIVKEIDEGIVNGKISSPITDEEAKQLPYLQAIIKEGLRILPPVSGLMDKEVPPEGDIIDGYQVPGGTKIG